MSRFRGSEGLLIRLTLLALLWEFGCSRPVGIPSEANAAQTAQTPFQDGSSSANPNLADTSINYSGSDGLPFHDTQDLAVGTLLTVRWKGQVSADKPGAMASFEASLDEPVVIEGNTLIPRGAAVIGRVESMHTSNVKPERGYAQLALESVHLAGVDLSVQTASLFVRQSSSLRSSSPKSLPKDLSSRGIQLEKGHRLTFRLTQPLYIVNQTAHLTH